MTLIGSGVHGIGATPGVTPGFLALFQAYFNLHVRRWGRHKGTSAYEVLRTQRVEDWLTLIGFPPSPQVH